MAMRILVEVLLFVIFSIYLDTADAVTGRYYCLSSQTTGAEFKFVVRLRKDGDNSITGITAVDASVTPSGGTTPSASTCVTSTEESSGIYALSGDVAVNGALPCGITSGGGTVYNVQILATGTSQYYTFSCDTTALLPDTVSVTNFATTGVTNVLHHRENPYDVKFQVFHADGSNAPATSVDLGQNIFLRLIYNTGHLENGPDNWGMVFHTGFIQHTTAVMRLQIVTAGLGTRVHITGQLSGQTIDKWVYVKRNVWAEVEIHADYHTTAAAKNDWPRETRGIKIESIHDRIGVISKAVFNDQDADTLVVFPDDILGTSYRPFQSVAANAIDDDQEVVVVATQDSTSVTIRYNSFNKPGGLDVDGSNVGGGALTTSVTLDEYEVLHILCDDECGLLEIDADENIAVVSGWDDQGHKDNKNDKGFSSAQIIPKVYNGDEYVFVESLFGEIGYHIQTDDPTDTTLSLTDKTRNSASIGSPYYLDWNGEGASEAQFSKKVSVYLHVAASSDGTPALVQYPSTSQWGIYNSFPVKEGITYSVTIVTTKGDAAGIKVSMGGVTTSLTAATLGTQTGFAGKLSDVSKLTTAGGGTANYEVFRDVINIVGQRTAFTERGLIEFTASETWKPFMLLVYEVDNDAQSLHLPFGVRYPPQNPCSTTTMRTGDNIDNDCDGMVDEEILNGADDDGDTDVDEDVALNPITSSFRGIYVKDLLVDDNSAFSSPTTIHSSGCNTVSPNTKLLSTVLAFTRNTGLDDVFDHFWVLDTAVFNAFRYVGKATVYFRVTFDFCVADLTLCESSCQASGKRKRSVEDGDNFVDLMVEVHGNETDVHIVDSNINDVIDAANRDAHREHTGIHPCINSVVLWLPAALLLAILLFEAVMTVVFINMKSKFKNDL